MFWNELVSLKISLKACKPVIDICELSLFDIEGVEFPEELRATKSVIEKEINALMSKGFKASMSHLESDSEKGTNLSEAYYAEAKTKKANFSAELWESDALNVVVTQFTEFFVRRLNEQDKLYLIESGDWVSQFIENICLENPELVNEENPAYSSFRDFLFAYFGVAGVLYWHCAYRIGVPESLSFSKVKDIEAEKELEEKIGGRLWFDLGSLEKRWKEFGIDRNGIIHLVEIGELEACFNWRALGFSERSFSFNASFHRAVTPLATFQKLLPYSERHYPLTYVRHCFQAICGKSELEDLAALDKFSAREIFSSGKSKHPTAGINGFQLDDSSFDNVLSEVCERHIVITCREIRRYEAGFGSKASQSQNLSDGAWAAFGVIVELLLEIEGYQVDADIKAAIRARYPGKRGLSNRSLDDFFAIARKHLPDR